MNAEQSMPRLLVPPHLYGVYSHSSIKAYNPVLVIFSGAMCKYCAYFTCKGEYFVIGVTAVTGAAVGCCTGGGVLVTIMVFPLPVVLRDELQYCSSMENAEHTNNIP